MTDNSAFEYPLDLTVITDSHYYSSKLGIDTPSYKKYDLTNQKAVKDSPAIISAAFAHSRCPAHIFISGKLGQRIAFAAAIY